MRFATREQLQKIHHLGSSRNALKLLGEMKNYLHVQNHKGVNVYYLNKEGRDLIGSTNEMKWSLQAEHHLMRNDLYIHYQCPSDWLVEKKSEYDKHVTGPDGKLVKKTYYVIPDARFTLEGVYYFLEVDNTQNMVDNRKKIQHYAELFPLMHKHLGHKPVIVFYTMTPIRQVKLREICEEYKISCEVYTKADLK